MKMIEDLILASGFRPSTMQMYKLYVNIILTSLVTYCTSAVFKGMEDVQPLDFLDNANPDDMVDNVADAAEETTFSDFPRKILNAISKLQIPGAIIGSALDGAANALMTLRIGYVTRHYIINGYENSMDGRRKVKREAMKSALRTMPAVLADSTSVIGEKAASFISKTYKFA